MYRIFLNGRGPDSRSTVEKRRVTDRTDAAEETTLLLRDCPTFSSKIKVAKVQKLRGKTREKQISEWRGNTEVSKLSWSQNCRVRFKQKQKYRKETSAAKSTILNRV